MKALIYKELKLAMHPICYIFMFAFPFMILIPSFPIAVASIYVLTTYPILFLGANKGQQSNDLLYSTLLPIRKKDIVFARIITVAIIQFTSLIISACLLPLSYLIQNTILIQTQASGVPAPSIPGLSLDGFLSIVGIELIGFALSDLIYFPIYYKKGRSIVASTILTILFYTLFILLFTTFIPLIDELKGYKDFLCNKGILPQLLIFGIGIILYVLIHFFVYKISAKNLEKVDF